MSSIPATAKQEIKNFACTHKPHVKKSYITFNCSLKWLKKLHIVFYFRKTKIEEALTKSY